MGITRRRFLKGSAAGLTALLVPPGWTGQARAQSASDPVLVVIFLRGGADGLNLVIPRGDPNYGSTLRPNLWLSPVDDNLLGPNHFFELHPELAPGLMPLYDGTDPTPLSIVHACGGTQSYSHFEAQDAMERVSPLDPGVPSGWLYKALDVLAGPPPDPGTPADPWLSRSGVSIGGPKKVSLSSPGRNLSLAIPSIDSFRFVGGHNTLRRDTLLEVYKDIPEGGSGARGKARMKASAGALFDSLSEIGSLSSTSDSLYTGVSMGARLFKDAARLIKGDIGVRVVAFDYLGWDHHTNQAALLDLNARNLGNALRSFYEDLGENHRDRTVTLVMTEFGRTAWENGGGGTEHGWGTTMFALGGNVVGGQVITRADPDPDQDDDPGIDVDAAKGLVWPGLGPRQLHKHGTNPNPPPNYGADRRDLKVTTDFRDVFSEVLVRHMGLSKQAVQDDVMNGHEATFPGLLPEPT